MKILDFPKLESPFVRKLNEKEEYIVTPEVAEGYEWVFENPDVIVVEKLHGTNVSIVIENGTITSIWNRTARIPFFNKGKEWISQGLIESYLRGYCELPDGQHFGELIGPKVNGNPYGLDKHIWIPFETYGKEHLRYRSWGKYPKTYDSISAWFKDLQPLYSWKIHGQAYDKHFVEGIVFYHPDGRMAKLRVDMFDFYTGRRHKENEVI